MRACQCGRDRRIAGTPVAVSGLVVLGLYGLGAVNTAALVEVPTAMFTCVYRACLAAAARMLAGRVRLAALVALPAVATILAFCGWSEARLRCRPLLPIGSAHGD